MNKEKKNARLLLFVLICVSGVFIFQNVFERNPSHRKEFVPPDKLPVLKIDAALVDINELVVNLKIQAVGETPVLITPRRLKFHITKLTTQSRGVSVGILDGVISHLVLPGNLYSKEFRIHTLKWFGGNSWVETPVNKLQTGFYEVKVKYNGTKEGFLRGDYDFVSILSSNAVQFEIK